MRRIYQIGSITFFALALFVIYESRKLNYFTELGPGPGFFPFWLGLFIGGLSIAWFGQVSLKPVEPMEEDFVPNRAGILRIMAILVALLIFGALVDTIGFQVIMFGFLLFLLIVLGRQNPLLTLVIAAVGSFGIYYLFRHYLDVQLPASSIEFLSNLGL